MLNALLAAAAMLACTGPAQQDQDEEKLVRRIVERIQKELDASAERLLRDIRNLVREELGKAGAAPAGQPKAGKPYMGFSADEFTDEQRKELGLEASQGIKVHDVRPDSPADKAGLMAGDIILSLDGERVSEGNIEKLMQGRAPGDSVTLSVLRDGEKLELKVELGARPPE